MIKVTKGATCNILATAYDENGVPIDLTTYSAEFAVKLKVSDPDPPLILLTNGAGVTYLNQATNPGQLRVVIEKEVTDTLSGGECWCDLHISLASARYQVIENTRMVVTVPVNLLGGGSPATPGQPSGYGHFVKKASAGTIAAGVPVYGVSYSAGYLLVEAAQHGVTPDAFGIMTTSTTDTTSGYATVIGTVGGVNTSGMTVGDRVFLGSSAFVTTRSPGRQELARVMVVSASAGVLNVNVGESDVIKRLTPTTWANIDLLTADPVAPVVRDIWGRTDNRLALQGDDAVTRYVWFTPSQPIAGASGAGAGLTLGAGPTLNVGANADGSMVVNADDIQVGVLATDAQHGLRGGGTQHALATTLANGFMAAADKAKLDVSLADWGITLVRYYFVDYDGGNDSLPGYIDATAGSTFTSGQTTAVAIKTLERLAQIMPRFGNGRIAVVLGKPRALGSIYRNIANTVNDVLDLRGYTGYEYQLVRGSDHTNSTTDRVNCGGVLNPAGPNGDGSFTISSVTDVFTFGIATTPWAVNSLNGRRIRFASTASAPYANQCRTVQVNATGNITMGDRVSATLPLVGDTFYVETPGFQVDRIIHGETQNAYKQTPTNSSCARLIFAGVSIAASANSAFNPGSASYAFFEQSAVTTNVVVSLAPGPLPPSMSFSGGYSDDVGTFRTTGGCIFNGRVSLYAYSALISRTAFNCTAQCVFVFSRSALFGGLGCYFAVAPQLTGCGWTAGSAGTAAGVTSRTIFGTASTTAAKRAYIAAGTLNVDYCHIQLQGLEFAAAAASTPYIAIRGQGCQITIDDCVGATGADVCVDIVNSFDSSIVFDRITPASAMTAALGAIRGNGGAIIATLASLAGRTVIDQARNRICGTGVMAVQNEQQLASDPASPVAADSWWRTDNRRALRGSDGITRYVTFVESGILNEVPVRTSDPVTLPVAGSVKVFYRTDTLQLCVMDSGGIVKRSAAFT